MYHAAVIKEFLCSEITLLELRLTRVLGRECVDSCTTAEKKTTGYVCIPIHLVNFL